jgi:hypothetical protein
MEHTAANGAKGNYFRVLRIEGICSPGEPVPRWEIWVGFYANQDIRVSVKDPICQYRVNIPFSDLQTDPRNGTMPGFYSAMKNYEPFVGQYVQDALEDSADLDLDVAKARRLAEINRARLAANTSSFTYADKAIACDALSRGDIDGVNGYVALMGDFPPGWVGKWKAADNSFVPIETLDDWKAFYAAMVNQGQSNFLYSQWLKQQVAAAGTVDDVDAIYWGLTPT